MKYQYITIENETGSGGTEIANIVANECGLPCFGAKEILQKVSQDYNFSAVENAGKKKKITTYIWIVHNLEFRAVLTI